MSLYQFVVNRYVIPVIEAHKAEGRVEGREEGRVEGRVEGREQGLAEVRAEWQAWNEAPPRRGARRTGVHGADAARLMPRNPPALWCAVPAAQAWPGWMSAISFSPSHCHYNRCECCSPAR